MPLVGMDKGAVALENCLGIYPREMKLYAHTETYRNVYCITHNDQKVETQKTNN